MARNIFILFSLLILTNCNFGKKNISPSEKIGSEATLNNLIASFEGNDGTLCYPDYYCGSYLDTIKGAIIYCKENTPLVYNDLVYRCKSNQFVIEKRDVGRNELLEIMHTLTNRLRETDRLDELGFVMGYIMERENRIGIVLEDTSKVNISRFKTLIMDSPLFLYQIGKMDFEEEYPIDPV